MSTFEAAAEQAKNLNATLSNDELLSLYGLYKQATTGDNTASAPWAVQVTAKAKWEAHEALKGTSQDDAKARYVKLVESMVSIHGLKA